MSSAVAECTNLLEPRRLDPSCLGRNPTRGVDHRFVCLRLVVRHPPPLACPRFVGTNEQHCELLAPRREENDIDRECRMPLTWSRGGGLRAFAHHARISHERRLMSRPRENCHESIPTAMRLSRAPIVGPTRDSVNVP